MKQSLLLICILLVGFTIAYAQPRDKPKGFQVSLGFDGIAYFGDFYEQNSRLIRVHPGFNFQLQRYHRRAFSLLLNGGFGQFADQYDQALPVLDEQGTPITFVETRFIYGDLRVSYEPPMQGRWQPYVTLGAGLIRFSPFDRDGRPLINRGASREEGEDYNAIIPQLPASLGFRTRLTKVVSAGAAYTYRFVPSDYLDNLGVQGSRQGFDDLHSLTLFLSFDIGVEGVKE